MKVLIYSDVHGNLPAFEKMLKAEGHCDAYICLGDLVNYGPWSNECVEVASGLPNAVLLMGNHEKAYINGYYPGDNALVQKFFQHTYPSFNKLEAIKAFLPAFTLGNYTCTHTIKNSYIYPDTTVTLDGNYIIGHSHHQFIYHNNGFTLYNAGSAGQNRKYINAANYLVYYADEERIELKETIFDINLLVKEMEARNYPAECIAYYKNKMLK